MKLFNISDCELGGNDHLALATTIPGMIAGWIEQVQLFVFVALHHPPPSLCLLNSKNNSYSTSENKICEQYIQIHHFFSKTILIS